METNNKQIKTTCKLMNCPYFIEWNEEHASCTLQDESGYVAKAADSDECMINKLAKIEVDCDVMSVILSRLLPFNVKVDKNGTLYDLYMVGTKKAIIVKPFMSNLETCDICELKPYLRPMSAMTEYEQRMYGTYRSEIICHNDDREMGDFVSWLHEELLDYNGLIEQGRALPAPEGMYKF